MVKKSSLIWDMPDFRLVIDDIDKENTDTIGFHVANVAKKNAPIDTGEYKAKINYFPENKEVRAEAQYSAALEYGVKAREIRPKNAKVLAFNIGGRTIFAKVVKQKARKPNPVMRNAAREVQKMVSKLTIIKFKDSLKRRRVRV